MTLVGQSASAYQWVLLATQIDSPFVAGYLRRLEQILLEYEIFAQPRPSSLQAQ